MARRLVVAVLSDVHYAGPAERARGDDYEFSQIRRPVLRWLMRAFRNFAWIKHPTRQNAQLDRCLAAAGEPDLVVVNGDLAYDGASLGLSDAATLESARECLARLQEKFGDRLRCTMGDHELGKLALAADRGGLRMNSWRHATVGLGLPPCWKLELGRYVLIGITSTLVALPAYLRDSLPEEQVGWNELSVGHLAEIRTAFDSVQADQRILLFCHDPTALPYLWEETAVRRKLAQLEQTIIGHLHSRLIFWKSRVLAGMPIIRCLGGNVLRMSMALRAARKWKCFRVRLCPALSGIELLNDGGFLCLELDLAAATPPRYRFHPLPR